MGHSQYKNAIKILKRIAKNQGLTYNDLAKQLQVPESTLKKWFNSADGSFNRLHRICERLRVRLSDVLQAIDNEQVVEAAFTESQQAYFHKNRLAFALYWDLVYERKEAGDIGKNRGLSKTELRRILSRLDSLNLIKLLSDERIKLPPMSPVRWSPNGVFLKDIFQEWTNAVLSESLQGKPKTNLLLQYFQLTEPSARELSRRIKELEEEFSRRTIKDMALSSVHLTRIRFLTATAEGSFVPNAHSQLKVN